MNYHYYLIFLQLGLVCQNIHIRFLNWNNKSKYLELGHMIVWLNGFSRPNMSSGTSVLCAPSLQSWWVRQHQDVMTVRSQNFSCAANINSKAHNTLKKRIEDVICQVTSLSFSECQVVQNWNQEICLLLNKWPHYMLITLCTPATALEIICIRASCIHHIQQICIIYQRAIIWHSCHRDLCCLRCIRLSSLRFLYATKEPTQPEDLIQHRLFPHSIVTVLEQMGID